MHNIFNNICSLLMPILVVMDKWTNKPLNIIYEHSRNLSEYEKLLNTSNIPFIRSIFTNKGIKKKSNNWLLNKKTNMCLFGRLNKNNCEDNFF